MESTTSVMQAIQLMVVLRIQPDAWLPPSFVETGRYQRATL
jgi:hypothetical protein